MTQYEIRTDHFEFRFGKHKGSIPAATGDMIFAWYMEETLGDSRVVGSFDTLDEAREEFKKHYANYGSTRAQKGMVWWLLVGDLAWIEENTYTEDGDFDYGGEVYDVSAQAYDPEENDE